MNDLALDGSGSGSSSGSSSSIGSESGRSNGAEPQVEDIRPQVEGSKPQVEILMATHNGDKYLSAQIESILAQDYDNILLTIFDDGSTDGTIRCIERYVDNLGKVRLVGSERIGLPAVFFHLLSFVDSQSYYIGYADQDDLWLPGKISRAVKLLGAKSLGAKLLDETSKDIARSEESSKCVENRPTLYCSRVFIADEQLQVTGITPIPEHGASFANALVQGIAPGSTMLFDRKAAGLLASFTPQDSPMHDWWTYLVVSAVGDVIFDQLPGLLYRQHNANARGVGDNGRWSWRKRILWHFQEGAHSSTRQAAELRRWLAGNPGMLPELDDFLDSQRTLTGRARYCITGSAHRQRKIDDLVFRILYLLGRI